MARYGTTILIHLHTYSPLCHVSYPVILICFKLDEYLDETTLFTRLSYARMGVFFPPGSQTRVLQVVNT